MTLPKQPRRFTGTCETLPEIIVAYLWEQDTWVPAHQLIKLDTPYGFVGSSGDVRARELARNECPDKLKDKVERAEGRDIGLDKRFAYFRYKSRSVMTREDNLKIAQESVEFFENYQPTTA